MALIEGNQANFKTTVLDRPGTVIVDFWAPWCGPCRMQTPILERLAADSSFNAEIVKVNVDENPSIAQEYGISSIPTLIIFNKGQLKELLIGVQTEEALKTKVF